MISSPIAVRGSWRALFLCGLASLSPQSGLLAQNRSADGVITVTADRRASSESVVATEVISRESIVRSGARNAADALENQPGLEIRPALRGRQIRMQGLDPQYVLILLNGDRINGRVDNSIDLTRIKAEEIERIEIVKGPLSAIYGSDAIGGVINIITREPRSKARYDADLNYGSGRESNFGSGNETNASASVGGRSETMSSNFHAGWHRSDGYDLTPFTDRDRLAEALGPALPNFDADAVTQKRGTTGPAFSDLNAGGRSRLYVGDDFRIEGRAYYRYLDQERIDVAPPRQRIVRRNRTHDVLAGFTPSYQLSDTDEIRFSYSHARFKDELSQDLQGDEESDRTETQDDRLHEFRLQWDTELFRRHLVTLGVDGIIEEFISPRLQDEYAFRQRVGAFAQDEWLIGERLRITPGVRYEEDGQFGAETTPKIALRYDATDEWLFRAGAGAGYRAPSFKDLYLSFQNPGVGYEVIGNPDLAPERSRGYNGSVEWTPAAWVWISLGGFYNRITNLIDFSLRPERPNDLAVFQPRNIREAWTGGGEFQIEFYPLEGMTLALGYTRTDSRDLDQELRLEGRALDRGSYRIEYEHPVWTVGFSLRGSVFGKQPYWYPREALFTLQANGTVKTDADVPLRAFLQQQEFTIFEDTPAFPKQGARLRNYYHIIDLRIWKRFENGYELYAGVDNALDAYNVELNPERPRFFYVGFSLRYEAPPAPAAAPEN